MEIAKLFYTGNSQAVRRPKAYWFGEDRVYIKRLGNAIVLLPYHDPWRALLDGLERFSDDFMETRVQGVIEERKVLFT